MNKRILISTSTFAEFDRRPLNLLESKGFSYVLNPYKRKLKIEETIRLGKEAVGIIAGIERLDNDVLQQLRKLKVISRCGSGMDNIDLKSAQRRKIKVYNTPIAPVRAVAELTVGVILNLLRRVNYLDYFIRNDDWQKKIGNLLYGKKVGIIGFGRIGKKVAELLRPFSCKIAYTDPFIEDGLMGLRRLSLRRLLAWADIVSIHVSGKDKILGENEFRLMREGAWLINISRGTAIDEKALYLMLKQGYLSGCAIDVFEDEPYRGALKELNNVILTPHIGSYTKETRIEMERQAVENLLKVLKA